ncbi:NUDIX domain-containing protein [Paenibacillus pinisoli]|uniref:NUDIX domain-containing protein n=1 Tax=Paenibacillus pinisoli TaxID=1276110 RepID=A0A3A6PT60_9BACL|nr:NUDIX domain-containing protein [Paenibacillus pinisoli]RJX38943.1 NUDIX domain-containing protein [Paenibacillus pinisoli]
MNDHSTTYTSTEYRTPDGAPTDIVVFTITSTEKAGAKKSLPIRALEVMLIKRKQWPFEGKWALPGGFTKETETVRQCAERELMEETGVSGVHLDYFNVYSAPGRDPRGWMISHAFFALVQEAYVASRRTSDEAADVRLIPVEEALEMDLAFDHGTILSDALDKIRQHMMTTTIAREFLPERFTMSELYQVIQTVVPSFQERNFIRKITSTQSRRGIIEEVRNAEGQPLMSNQYSQRPAQLYRFTDYTPELSIYG